MRDEKGRVATESERAILDIIYRNPGIARSALTRHTDWTQQQVYRLVDSLLARNLLLTGRGPVTGPGQPSPKLTLNQNGGYAFGISLNTDAIRLSLINLGCQVIESVFVETDPASKDQAIKDIRLAAKQLMQQHDIAKDKVIGFGLAITGYRLKSLDVYKSVEPLHEWSGIPLLPLLESELGYPVWIENNANAGAIAESLVGAGQEHLSFCYLSFNYGFGGGIIVNGEPLAGAHGNAGEFSSIFCADQMASRPALGELIKRIKANGSDVDSIRTLNQRFDRDLPGLQEWITEVTPLLELTIRAVSAIADSSAIVFGGEAPPELQQMLIAACDPFRSRQEEEFMPAQPVLLQSCVEGEPATFGAALLPVKKSVLL